MTHQSDIVEELRQLHEYERRHNPPPNRLWAKAAALIETQAAEIERLRGALEQVGLRHGWAGEIANRALTATAIEAGSHLEETASD